MIVSQKDYSNYCRGTNQLRCEVGDMSGKHGKYTLNSLDSPLGKKIVYDASLPLTGRNGGMCNARARAHTHTHARTHARTHTHTHTHTVTLFSCYCSCPPFYCPSCCQQRKPPDSLCDPVSKRNTRSLSDVQKAGSRRPVIN